MSEPRYARTRWFVYRWLGPEISAVLTITAMLGVFPQSVALASPHADMPPEGGSVRLSGSFRFTEAPLVGAPAELVLEVTAATDTRVTTEISLPRGVERVAGSLYGSGSLGPEMAWQTTLVIQVLFEGEYMITAQIDARAANGKHDSAQAHIYVASSSDRASASELKVAIPEEMVVIPLCGFYRIIGASEKIAGFDLHASGVNQRWTSLTLNG